MESQSGIIQLLESCKNQIKMWESEKLKSPVPHVHSSYMQVISTSLVPEANLTAVHVMKKMGF